MAETQRLFCMFGSIKYKQLADGTIEQTFINYKSQEIPLFYYDAHTQNYVEKPKDSQIKKDYLEAHF